MITILGLDVVPFFGGAWGCYIYIGMDLQPATLVIAPLKGLKKNTGVDVDDEARLELFGIKW